MPRPLGDAIGDRLDRPAYHADFHKHYAHASEFWKLERAQAFAEPYGESWRAFDRGDWEESLRLLEKDRARIVQENRQDAERGMFSKRVRVVSLPPTGYLHWELYSHKISDEAGEIMRVVLDTDVADVEDQGPLPEIVTIDTAVMYQVIYDENGVANGAIRYTDEPLVRRCRDFIVELYERGEPMSEFFAREIAPLPPPRPTRSGLPHDYVERRGRLLPPRT
jgi:hypothetical protein